MNQDNPVYRIIDTRSELEQVVAALEREKVIAVDLESDSMYHFKDKVCLIQIATKKSNLVIDPLRIKDLSPIKSIFYRDDIKKIFHGADYDVRSLFRDFSIEIHNLFDTQIGAMFLGIHETSLEAILHDRFEICLNKKYQKKDWSVRPLPKDMLAYAANDVKYLLPLAAQFETELGEKGRLYWVIEECEMLSKVRPAPRNKDPLFLKFKGASRLDRRTLAVLEALLKFRKKIAKRKDRPLFKILRNISLMKIAMALPADIKQLEATGALSRKQIEMYGEGLISTVDNAMKISEEKLPMYPFKKRPAFVPGMSKRVRVLKSWRDEKAKMLEIHPALICTNAIVSAISKKNPLDLRHLEKVELMKHWQKKEFGEEIVALLRDVA